MDHARWIGRGAAQLLFMSIDAKKYLSGSSSHPLLFSAAPSSISEERKSYQVYYWDRGRGEEEEKSSPLYESFIQALPDLCKVSVVNSDPDWQISADEPVLMFCNLTSFCDTHFKSAWSSRFEELLCRSKCVQQVAVVLKVSKRDSNMFAVCFLF